MAKRPSEQQSTIIATQVDDDRIEISNQGGLAGSIGPAWALGPHVSERTRKEACGLALGRAAILLIAASQYEGIAVEWEARTEGTTWAASIL